MKYLETWNDLVQVTLDAYPYLKPKETPMSNLAPPHATIIAEQVKRIHGAIHDGSTDKATIDDALVKLTELAAAKEAPTPPSYGGKSDAQNRAAPRQHTGEPSHVGPGDPNYGNPVNPGDPNYRGDDPDNRTPAQRAADARVNR